MTCGCPHKATPLNTLTMYFYQLILFLSLVVVMLLYCFDGTAVSTVLIICKAFVTSSLITLNSWIVIRMGRNMSWCIKYSWVFPATGYTGGF